MIGTLRISTPPVPSDRARFLEVFYARHGAEWCARRMGLLSHSVRRYASLLGIKARRGAYVCVCGQNGWAPMRRGGGCATLNPADVDRVAGFSWYDGGGYAHTAVSGRVVKMHRMITEAPAGLDVDHINGDKRDNRRTNLRVVTHAQNMQNIRKSNNRTGYRGVTKVGGKRHCYSSSIQQNGSRVYIGCFASAELAAKAYDETVVRLRGPHVVRNFAEAV